MEVHRQGHRTVGYKAGRAGQEGKLRQKGGTLERRMGQAEYQHRAERSGYVGIHPWCGVGRGRARGIHHGKSSGEESRHKCWGNNHHQPTPSHQIPGKVGTKAMGYTRGQGREKVAGHRSRQAWHVRGGQAKARHAV